MKFQVKNIFYFINFNKYFKKYFKYSQILLFYYLCNKLFTIYEIPI